MHAYNVTFLHQHPFIMHIIGTNSFLPFFVCRRAFHVLQKATTSSVSKVDFSCVFCLYRSFFLVINWEESGFRLAVQVCYCSFNAIDYIITCDFSHPWQLLRFIAHQQRFSILELQRFLGQREDVASISVGQLPFQTAYESYGSAKPELDTVSVKLLPEVWFHMFGSFTCSDYTRIKAEYRV